MLENSGTDIFGLGLPNPKIMADLFAERTRLDVYVPDYFQGQFPLSVFSFPFLSMQKTKYELTRVPRRSCRRVHGREGTETARGWWTHPARARVAQKVLDQ